MIIADLHCDLLLYLQQNAQRTAYDSASRCSIPQMRQGSVKLQVLPIYAPTCEDSVQYGLLQNDIFFSLPHQYPNDYCLLDTKATENNDRIAIIRAVENASAFCNEDEPLKEGLKRLERLLSVGKIAYISLTWNTENRFGGGSHTTKGLTEDGKALLLSMDGKRIAADLSHASDTLAYDVLDFLDKHSLDVPVIASHSNCRAIWNVPRNLPDGLIKEIIKRKGLIGLNFIRGFVNPSTPEWISKHLEHLLSLNGEHAACFGADFFYEQDIPAASRLPDGQYFFDALGNSSTYDNVLKVWKKTINVPPIFFQKVAHDNVARFVSQRIL